MRLWPPYALTPLRAPPSLATVDLTAHECDGALIDRGGIPGLDGCEVGFSRLVPSAGAPAVRLEEIRRRTKRVGSIFEIAGAVLQDGLGQKLGLADFAVHRAARARREHAAIDQFQRGVELVRKILRPPAIVGERCNRREHVLISALSAKSRLHSPDRDQRPRWHAIALLDRCEQRALRLPQRASASDDGRSTPLGEKLFERQSKTSLAAIGSDGSARVARPHQGGDRRGADAFGASFLGELLLPALETGGPAAASRGVCFWAQACEHCQDHET